jgi:hypothetical protein
MFGQPRVSKFSEYLTVGFSEFWFHMCNLFKQSILLKLKYLFVFTRICLMSA